MKGLIRAPRQDRSQRTMDRVVDATTKLLEHHSFDEITLAQIARESGTGSGSIYARFKDKRAILLAVHQRVRERAIGRFEDLCHPERWTDASIETALTSIITGLLGWYRENHNVMKAALLLNDRIVYGQIANSLHAGAIQLSYLIQDKIPGHDRRLASRKADFIFRIVTATFQQIAIFDEQPPTVELLEDGELVAGLTLAAVSQLKKT